MDSFKDNSTTRLSTPNKTPKLSFRVSLSPPTKSSSILAKKLHYIIIPAEETKPKKKINGNIKEQNVVIKKIVKKQLKAYAGFLTDITKNQSLLAQRAAFYIGLIFYKKLHCNQFSLLSKN